METDPKRASCLQECLAGDIEDVKHWLPQCSAWQTSRLPLMKKMMECIIDFPRLNNEAKVALILTTACQSPAIMKKTYINIMWTDKFCS